MTAKGSARCLTKCSKIPSGAAALGRRGGTQKDRCAGTTNGHLIYHVQRVALRSQLVFCNALRKRYRFYLRLVRLDGL